MAFQYISGASGYVDESGTEVSCSSTLDIAAGDLLVAVVKFDGLITTVGIADAGDTSNSFTMLDVTQGESDHHASAVGYKLSATAKSTSTLKMTLGASRAYAYVAVMQFRPDAGEDVTLEAAGVVYSDYEGGAHTSSSNTISPSGDDLCVVACVGNYAVNLSAQAIGDSAATGIIERDGGYGSIWYRLFTSSQTDIDADVTISSSDYAIINILAFKSVEVEATNVVMNIV